MSRQAALRREGPQLLLATLTPVLQGDRDHMTVTFKVSSPQGGPGRRTQTLMALPSPSQAWMWAEASLGWRAHHFSTVFYFRPALGRGWASPLAQR